MDNRHWNFMNDLFTDEPKAPAGAFNKELAEKNEDMYGESILPYLLFGNIIDYSVQL